MVRLKSSTLIEVLIAMVILLCVFGIGMMIFANLDRSSSNLESRVVREQLHTLASQYQQDGGQNNDVQIDSISYFFEEIPLEGIQDRVKLKVYAERIADGQLIDSLVRIYPISTNAKI